MTKKPAAQSTKTVVIHKPEDREPDGPGSLKYAAGSDSRAFNSVLLNSVLSCLWLPENVPEQTKDDQFTAALGAMSAFKPQDEVEGMIAGQAVAMHHASMECFRRAMIAQQPGEVAARYRRDGASLARGMIEMVEALERKRGKRPQVVRVERVVI